MTKFLILSIVMAATIVSINAQVLDGMDESKREDNDVTELVQRLKPDILKTICENGVEKCPSDDVEIEIKYYQTQSVSGTNYFISATIDGVTYRMTLYSQPWTQTEKVMGIQGPNQIFEDIETFHH